VVLFKENHTQLTEAATLDRKSGEAEGPAVRLPRHSVTTVPIEGWASVKNRELLALIGEAGFSAFISADKESEYTAVASGSSICAAPG
jgi:hypothetical protein